MSNLTPGDVLRTAASLLSDDGENPEYDRAITELVANLIGSYIPGTLDVGADKAYVRGFIRGYAEAASAGLRSETEPVAARAGETAIKETMMTVGWASPSDHGAQYTVQIGDATFTVNEADTDGTYWTLANVVQWLTGSSPDRPCDYWGNRK